MSAQYQNICNPARAALFAWCVRAALFFLGVLFLYVLGLDASNDAGDYRDLALRMQDVDLVDAVSTERFEIGFTSLYWGLAQLYSPAMAFFMTGLAALSAKYYLLNKHFHYPLIAWIVYITVFLPVHEVNQIRTALAMCFVLYALIASESGKSYLLLTAAAALFHWSGLILLSFYFIRSPLIGLASVALLALAWNFIVYTGADLFGASLSYLSGTDTNVNLASSIFIAQACISAVCALQWKRLSVAQRKGAYLLMIGTVLYISFYENAIMAHRLRELSLLGILPLLFLDRRKLTYPFLIMLLCVAYIVGYNLWVVMAELSGLYLI